MNAQALIEIILSLDNHIYHGVPFTQCQTHPDPKRLHADNSFTSAGYAMSMKHKPASMALSLPVTSPHSHVETRCA